MEIKEIIPDDLNKLLLDATFEAIEIGCSDTSVYRVKTQNDTWYLKIGKDTNLIKEHNALVWLAGKLLVPKVIYYQEANGYQYLLTEGIQGEMIFEYKEHYGKDLAMEIIIQAFKDIRSVDISDCPFDVGIDYKLALVRDNLDKKLVNDDGLKAETLETYGSAEGLYQYLFENKFYDEIIFSHGDTSLPNIFGLGDKLSGLIDVGECGKADAWFDLAICQKSILRNFGQDYVDLFYKKLNIIPDEFKINYYLLLMELYL